MATMMPQATACVHRTRQCCSSVALVTLCDGNGSILRPVPWPRRVDGSKGRRGEGAGRMTRGAGSGVTRAVAVAAAGATTLLLAGCASAALPVAESAPPTTPAATAPAASFPATGSPGPPVPIAVSTEEYLPGIEADLRVPPEAGPAPLVVLVPGGGWQSADRTGLGPLADTLSAAGATTATITYRTASDGVTFPVPVDDVACAVRWAAARATQDGRPPTRTIVAGHSAGGHLAALAALSGDEFGGDCPAPPVAIDGLVGIAGVYDLEGMESALTPLFGGTRLAQPDAWDRGSPITWAARDGLTPPGFRTLLIHGPADELVPVEQSLSLAETLTARGVDTLVEFANGATHQSVYQADVAAPLIQSWLDSWS